MNPLPITSKLNPLAGARNLAYLAEIAALTRLTTGLVRVNENRPDKLKDPKLTENQKRQAFWERVFVEIIGTAGYIFFLHLGQDLISKFIFEPKVKIPVLNREALRKQGVNLTEAQVIQANAAIRDVFGPHSAKATHEGQGLIYRVLYGDELRKEGKTVIQRANMATLREKLGNELFGKVRPFVDDFARFANRAASMSIVGGVLISVLYGGFVTQFVNDRIVAPLAKRWLHWRYGESAEDVAKEKAQKLEEAQEQARMNAQGATGYHPPPVQHRPPVAMPAPPPPPVQSMPPPMMAPPPPMVGAYPLYPPQMPYYMPVPIPPGNNGMSWGGAS